MTGSFCHQAFSYVLRVLDIMFFFFSFFFFWLVLFKTYWWVVLIILSSSLQEYVMKLEIIKNLRIWDMSDMSE